MTFLRRPHRRSSCRMQEPHFLTMVLAFLPVLYASCFVHELGHAVAGKSTGWVVTSFGMGHRRPFCVIPIAGTRVFFCLERPRVGITFAFPARLYPSRGQTIAYLAGGVVANGGLATLALALALWLPQGLSLWLAVAFLNAVLAVSNMVPFHVKAGAMVLQSDGALILQVLRFGALVVPPPRTI